MSSEADVESAREEEAFKGPREGRLPNIYWRAISWETLRESSRFTDGLDNSAKFMPLPPVDSIRLDHLSAWRLLRQSSSLWAKAHKGVVSSGRIAAALGFFQPEVAQKLRIPRHQWNQYAFAEALRNLHCHTCEICHLPWRDESVEETLNLLWLPNLEESEETHTDSQVGEAATQKEPLSFTGLDAARSGASSVAGQGIQGVRCRWGRVQEPGFLLRLSELPPMGASPDAMLWVSKSPKLVSSDEAEWTLVGCIELKSLCPFQLMQKSRRKGGKGSECFSLRDRLSAWEISPQVVAQCQLQMLCTETVSTLVAARSLSGIKMYRMQRDDAYLRALLRLCVRLRDTEGMDAGDALERLVSWKTGGPRDKGKEICSYDAFLQRTRSIAVRVNREDLRNEDPRPLVPRFVRKSWTRNAKTFISPKPEYLFLD